MSFSRRLRMMRKMRMSQRKSQSCGCCPMMNLSFLNCSCCFCLPSMKMIRCCCSYYSLVMMSCCVKELSTALKVMMTLRASNLMMTLRARNPMMILRASNPMSC